MVAKNKGLAKIKQISNILVLGKSTAPDEYIDSLSPQEAIAFKFEPITLSDVERSFSSYNFFLTTIDARFQSIICPNISPFTATSLIND